MMDCRQTNEIDKGIGILPPCLPSGELKIFSGSVLKLMAVITMLIDHTALVIFSHMEWAITPFLIAGRSFTVYFLLRKIGRLAFPLFCFLITEGFIHTKNRKQYGLSLLLFAIISEIPWNLMVSGEYWYVGRQNVYFTLFLGFLLLCIFENVHTKSKTILCLIGLYVAAYVLKSDYGFRGVVLIGILYFLRDQKIFQALFAFPMLSGGIAAFCSFVPINMYNGKRGFIKNKPLKYAFYLFYPLHIMVLLIVKHTIL